MKNQENNIDRLLRSRARIDGELRQFESVISILFTDLVGSTAYFERYGDTAGMAMLHRHADLATQVARAYHGRVIKTMGDSVMAEFSDPVNAAHAAIELQRQLLALNLTLPERERLQLRVGINHGPAIRYGTDVYGDAVNVAARIVKHTGPAQILVSNSVRNAIQSDPDIRCTPLGGIPMKGKTEQEELFEVVWTGPPSAGKPSYSRIVAPPLGKVDRRASKAVGLGLTMVLIAAGVAGGSYWWVTRPRTVVSTSRLQPPPVNVPAELPTPANTSVNLKDGSQIRLTLAEDIPTDATEGTAVRFEVTADVRVGDTVVIRQGATAVGSIVDTAKKKHFGRSDKMTFHLITVDAVDGQKLAIRATPTRASDGSSKRPVDTGVGKSKDVAASAGTRYWGYIDGPQTVSVKN
jgi:class 3 adenylate cyclase